MSTTDVTKSALVPLVISFLERKAHWRCLGTVRISRISTGRSCNGTFLSFEVGSYRYRNIHQRGKIEQT